MRKLIFNFVVCFLVLAVVVPAYGQLSRFAGTWKNVDPNTRGVTKLAIKTTPSVTVHAWGACTPKDCDWGIVKAVAYAPSVTSDLVTTAKAIIAIYKPSHAETIVVIRPYGKSQLKAEVYTKFTDGSKRTDYCNTFIFKRLLLKPIKQLKVKEKK